MTNQIQNKHIYNDGQFQQSKSDDEVELRELFSILWRGKWIIVIITIIFVISSVILSFHLPNIYKSEALLAPTESEGSATGLATLAGQFGGLASMAGINLGGAGSDKAQLAIEVMKSHQFIADFIRNHNILPELMAVEKWHMTNNKLTYIPEMYDPSNKTWVRVVALPKNAKPSSQEAYKVFLKNFGVSQDKETGMLKVWVEHQSPYIAKQWVDWLVSDINRIMKERDVNEAIRSTEFLKKQIEMTNVADIRAVLYKLVEEQAKTIMFAEVRNEYVFKTIDPALVPEERIKPKRIQLVLIGLILGLSVGFFAVILLRVFKKRQ